MPKLGIRCVRRVVSGADLTGFGKAVCTSLMLVLSCVLSPAFAQASAGCTPDEGNGTSNSPYRIDTLCELQGISSSPTAHYELVADIDASETVSWNGSAGFRPIASTATDGFSGSFMNASDHEISSLTISRSSTDNVGLFSRLAAGATIRGIILADSSTTGKGTVGSLVGTSLGNIAGCSATGSVSGRGDKVGGLVGLQTSGDISDSYATGNVSGNDLVGGLVGQQNDGARISGSSAAGSVFGGVAVGGLVGAGFGGISDSYATGLVSGRKFSVGGFSGYQNAGSNISNSSATGTVFGESRVGGLVGTNFGRINNSYATGSVSGQPYGDGFVGGLVGSNVHYIGNSYATGSVFGQEKVGGLVGQQSGEARISDSYATGSVSGRVRFVGGLVGGGGGINNSYYAARGRDNGLGTERTFTQLRCPTTSSATCGLSSTNQRTYEGWDGNAWDFGSTTELPQLSSNQNSELNLKPYINGSDDLVVVAGFTGTTQFSLVADYLGPSGEFVILTWSLSSVPTPLRHLVYFDLGGGTTSTTFTDSGKLTDGASTAMLVVVGNEELPGRSFYVVLKNNTSANDDRIRVRTEVEQPYIRPDEDIRPALVEGITTFSFSIANAGPAEQPVTLTWSLEGVPTTLRHLVYFDLGDGSTSTTYTDFGKLTGSASPVTLVVVGNKELAGRSFYVVLKNNISANDDRIRVQVEVGPPNIVRDDDIRPASVGSTTTFGFSVGYTGSSVPVTLTWSLEDVPTSLRHLVYFDLEGGTTGLVTNGSAVTLTVVVNEGLDELAGEGFYVVLKNGITANDDRFSVRIAGASPLVDGGRDQSRMIRDALLDNNLIFSATDSDSPYSDGAGLSWSFLSTDIAEGSTVRFIGTPRGGTVKVVVTRNSLGHSDVGSFVLAAESPAGVKTTFTVTIETTCSTEPGADLMTGQTGAGTSDDPYRIMSLCQLQDISSNPAAHYELAADINASVTEDWNGGAGFKPIASTATGGFSGSFVNAGDYLISSLIISRSTENDVGLFSKLTNSAKMQGIRLAGSRTTGRDNVGSLVGSNAGVVEDSSVTGSVSGGDRVGGLVGQSNGNIINSYAASTVTGTRSVGGLVGSIIDGSISGSSATGSVVGTGNNIGGLVGQGNGNINNSYAASTVTGTRSIGGLVGSIIGGSISGSSATGSVVGTGNNIGGLVGQSNGNIINSYAASTVTGTRSVGGLVGSIIDGSISGSSATGSVVGTGNNIGGLVGQGNGNINNSYAASTVTGTRSIGGLVGSIIGGSISGSSATGSVVGTGNNIGGLVGYIDGSISGSSATGSVSGNDEVGGLVGSIIDGSISGSSAMGSVVGTGNNIGGLVGYIDGSISDSYATGSVSGVYGVGGLAGGVDSGDISGSYATGSVVGIGAFIGGLVGISEVSIRDSSATGSVSGDDVVGGLVGSSSGDISDSSATGSVVGSGNNIGGLVGQSSGNINNSYAASTVTGTDSVGGLAGRSSGVFVGRSGNISGSYAVGSVSGGSRVGGLVGEIYGNINNSYATGSVSGIQDVGGLAGLLFDARSINNSYATGSVFGDEYAGGLVGRSNGNIVNSYYAARGRNNGLGTKRSFAQLRCPMVASATCSLPGSDQRTYEDWDANVWDFGTATELPQLSSNQNSDLNRKPYVKGSADLVVVIGSVGIARLSLGADYLGSPGESVTLTWSLPDVPTTLRHLVYFDLGLGTTGTTFTDPGKPTSGASTATLVVVDSEGLAGNGFYVVLKNNISANDDRVSVRVEVGSPNIVRDDDIRPAPVGSTTTFSFSVDYTGSLNPVTLTWTLEDVPTTLRHLVYFDLGNNTTSTTFADFGKLTDSASPVTLVVVGNKELADRSFYVVLKNNTSASDDRVKVRVEGDPPNILGDDDIRQAPVGKTTIISFSVGYTGSPVPVTLTWSLLDVPSTLSHLVYFDLAGNSTSTTFTDPSVLTSGASMVTLVVVGDEGLADRSFYVVLRNNVSGNVARVMIQARKEDSSALRVKVYLGGAVR